MSILRPPNPRTVTTDHHLGGVDGEFQPAGEDTWLVPPHPFREDDKPGVSRGRLGEARRRIAKRGPIA